MQCNNISLSILNKKDVVKNLTFSLNKNDKLAIIGEEGNGKSTLIKLFYDKKMVEDYTEFSGSFYPTKEVIGYLPQTFDINFLNSSVEEFLFMDDIDSEINYDFYSEYNKIRDLFRKFNINDILLSNRKMNELSGGERVKISLIKILIRNPQGLILDEPTNDLDMDTYIWLEDFLKTTTIPLIFISHDINLLSKVANCILHLEQIKRKSEMKWTYFEGGYDEYIEKRGIQLDKQDKEHYRTTKIKEEKEKKLAKLHSLVENDLNQAVRNPSLGRLLAKKMKNIKSQEAKLDTFEVTEAPSTEEAINCFFDVVDLPNRKVIFELKEENIKIDDKILIQDVNLKIVGPVHLVFIGKNGVGKTTLLNRVTTILKKNNLNFDIMPQNYEALLPFNKTPIEYLQKIFGYEKEISVKIHNYLGAMKFKFEEMNTCILELSGGQKAKLFIIKMILNNANCLILDEPTRNLSPLSIPVFLEILKKYNGCIISVSHDRSYIDSMDEVYEIKNRGINKIK